MLNNLKTFFKEEKLAIGLLILVVVSAIAVIKSIKPTPAPAPTPAPVVKKTNDIGASSVMITTRELNHGGTGIILGSSSVRTIILTNDHVCKAIKDVGGVVIAKSGNYQVASIIESQLSDLCLVQVLANLGIETLLSNKAPKMYESVSASGHPALLPNVITRGHLSGRKIIEVMTGIRPCTDAERSSQLGMICMFFGGMPVVKAYESVLISATIMPGSSGSGVYNSDNELIGVVFAGSGDFGYGWTVPYEQVVNFLFTELQRLSVQNLNQEVTLFKQDESKKIKEVLRKCDDATNETILNYCGMLKRDMIWRN